MRFLLALFLVQSPSSPVGESVRADTLRVHLVRHGQAFSNLDAYDAQPEEVRDHLTPLGREQARAVGRALRGAFALVATSPAKRARETAQELTEAGGPRPVTVDERLRPMELGTGSDGAPLEWAARLEEWTAGRDPVPAAGESFQQVGERVQAVIDELLAAGAGRGVVLVAHSEVIGAFLRHLQPQGAGRNLDRLDNGGITVVEARAGSRPVVVSVNRIPPATAPPE